MPLPRRYFDNAGRAYDSRAKRDEAELRRLAEQQSRFPAMSEHQQEVLRKRAFARLRTLDSQPAP